VLASLDASQANRAFPALITKMAWMDKIGYIHVWSERMAALARMAQLLLHSA
jgi:hypothetical protein